MIIRADDFCRCGQRACGHTVGVFNGGMGDTADIKKIWNNKNRGLLTGTCQKFIPRNNLKYLEMMYEEKEK